MGPLGSHSKFFFFSPQRIYFCEQNMLLDIFPDLPALSSGG